MLKVIYVLGACFAALGIAALLAASGQSSRELVLSVGASFFSLGILMIAAGFYLHSRKLKSQFQAAAVKEKKADRKTEKICSVCNQEAAQVFCRVHVLRLCSNCLDRHDDGRNCLYVPAKRAAAAYK
jgi:sulfite exporter TauE/SafE